MTGPELSKVAIFSAPGRSIELRDVPLPELAQDEVLVRVTYATICGSDLHTFTGRRSSPLPSILGHETIGTVEATGGGRPMAADESVLKVGDRVTWSVAASCSRCHRCVRGLPQKCQSLFKYGHEELTDSEGFSGGLAEHCILRPGTSIVRLADEISDAAVCPVSCATATAAAAVRAVGAVSDRRAVVFGAGMLGLSVAAMLRSAGASSVCVVDPDETRRVTAESFGATETGRDSCGSGFDLAFEMSGSSAAVASSVECVAIGGRVVLAGCVKPGPAVPLDPESIIRRVVSIHGIHNYTPQDLATAVRFLEEDGPRFPFADLVEKSFPLADVNEAFTFAEQQRPIRVAVVP